MLHRARTHKIVALPRKSLNTIHIYGEPLPSPLYENGGTGESGENLAICFYTNKKTIDDADARV